MAQGILLDNSKVLEVKIEGDYFHIIYGFHQFTSFHKDDRLALRIVIVQLVSMGVSRRKLSRIFKVHRMSIKLWVETYAKEGMEGLIELKQGPEVKVTVAVKDYIYALYKKLEGKRGLRSIIIKEVEELYGIKISRETIRRVVVERKSMEQVDVKEERSKGVEGGDNEEESKEVMVKHGGVLIVLPLLAKYHAQEMVFSEMRGEGNGYTYRECVFSILLLLTARLLKVEEDIKNYDDEGMGGLIGRKRLPSLRTIRQVMMEMIEEIGNRVEELKVGFARACLFEWGMKNLFYIDGHFMPYAGEENILFGYNTVKRLAEKGRTAYVVNTAEGRPIYEVLSDGYDHFIENIKRILVFLKKELKVIKPTIVFDRGGFSWEFMKEIEEEAYFICWYKGKVLPGKQAKWEEVKMPIESNIYGEPDYQILECSEKVLERGDESGKGFRRIFFIKKGAKISPAISNNRDETLSDLVIKLTRRWGAQENVFKELKEDGFDRIHSYVKSPYDVEYFVKGGLNINREMENPKRRKLEKEKRVLQNKRDRMLGRIARKEKESGKHIKQTKKQKERFDKISERLTGINIRLTYLPKKVLRIDHIKENEIMRLSSDKKKYFDLLNLLAFNVRKDIVEIIGPIYQNNRDINQMVLKILRKSVIIKYGDDETKISFHSPSRRKERETLEVICNTLTSRQYRSNFFPGKLIFSAS